MGLDFFVMEPKILVWNSRIKYDVRGQAPDRHVQKIELWNSRTDIWKTFGILCSGWNKHTTLVECFSRYL